MPRWSPLSPGTRIYSTCKWRRRWISSLYSLLQAAPTHDQHSTPRWADSLLLPKTAFPLYNDPSKDRSIKTKTTEGLYQWQSLNANGPLFVFLDGPPYANGDLHIDLCECPFLTYSSSGHALNKILKDIINRYHVSLGHRVHYHPGWDCHGLPIENKVLKQLGVDVNELTPLQVREEAENCARKEVASQMAQFQQFGIMATWGSHTTYRTLDPDYELRQLDIFKTMVEKALAEAELEYNDAHVSHSVYITFPLDHTCADMSEALRALTTGIEKVHLLVWTTTPWTLTANMAIAVNTHLTYRVASIKDGNDSESILIYAADREDALKSVPGLFASLPNPLGEILGSDLVGGTYRPIFAPLHELHTALPSLPIIPSAHVTNDSGTGLVHCAPAHGAEDYAVMQSLGRIPSSVASSSTRSHNSSRELVCHVNGLGQFTADVADVIGKEAAGELVAKDILSDGGRAIVGLLTKVGALRKVQRFKHRYPYDWKTAKPVISLATSQWFANLDGIKSDAVAALRNVNFVPAISRNRLESFVQSRSEWCISRQRVWGVPIPSLHHLPSNAAVLDSESLTHILAVLRERGPRYWWDGPVSVFVPPSRRNGLNDAELDEQWEKGTDTMDVWFDSGTAWSTLEGLYASQAQNGAQLNPTFGSDVCLEGTDQHRGWFQSLLLTSLGAATSDARRRTAPYSTLITHGMVLDEQGKKMSKSLGNIISPLTVINGTTGKHDKAYGADILRLWVATVEFGKDMTIGPTVLQQCAETMRKIRNSSRFILGSLGDRPFNNQVAHEELGLADRYVLHRLHKLDTVARAGYEAYNFPQVINEVSYFANITLSSFYFDMNKDCLYADRKDSIERRRVLTVLDQALTTMTRVLAPVLPHLAEEIHQTLHGSDAPSVFVTPWVPLPHEFVDAQADADMDKLFRIRSKVNSLLEQARRDGVVKSSLSADVAFSISTAATPDVIDVLGREETMLKSLFGVSGVNLCDRNLDAAPAWQYRDSLEIDGTEIEIAVRPAALEKCPRCWTYTRPATEELCHRCTEVVCVQPSVLS